MPSGWFGRSKVTLSGQLHRLGLIAPIVGTARDDDGANPLEDFRSFRSRSTVKVVGKMPSQTATLRIGNVGEALTGGRFPGLGHFASEIFFGQAVSMLDALEHQKTDRTVGNFQARCPVLQRLAIKGVALADDRPLEMMIAVAMAFGMQRESCGEAGGFDPI